MELGVELLSDLLVEADFAQVGEDLVEELFYVLVLGHLEQQGLRLAEISSGKLTNQGRHELADTALSHGSEKLNLGKHVRREGIFCLALKFLKSLRSS